MRVSSIPEQIVTNQEKKKRLCSPLGDDRLPLHVRVSDLSISCPMALDQKGLQICWHKLRLRQLYSGPALAK